ncbi:MAG: HAMP domain-containing histidine kinase [Solirubrobacterales bacterium]|nr:HAMP domain-containing histidine kinase [Solirubrobacterales bacterium]
MSRRRRSRPPRGRSLRDKLTLLFFAVTAAAVGVLYFLVVPELESNLREQKLEGLARIAEATQEPFDELTLDPDITAPQLDERVTAIANAIDARITLWGIQQSLGERPRGDDGRFYVISDSREERAYPENLPLLRDSVRTGDLVAGETLFRGERLAQVAQPLVFEGEPSRVVVYSRSLTDVAETVDFVRTRLLAASGVALLLALVGGALVAQSLARRVRRLETAAEDVAAGEYVEPLPVDSSDELGQLTAAFNAMQEQLRRVEVARREFVATASHELRTPIFSLGGFVELLADEDLDPEERREFLAEISEQVERLKKLAVDLLDLSRLDSGSLALTIETVDLAELARTVAGEFGPALAEHGGGLLTRLPEDGVLARCDRERTAQIVRILLDNAIRHTPPGTTLSISAGADSAGAALTVADEGPGLPADRPVFDPFITGGASKGAGLGLAIARELAGRMDGSLRARDQVAGAVLTLQLPAAGAGGGNSAVSG